MDYLHTFLSQKKRHEGEVIVWYVLKIQLKLKNVRQISGKISAQPYCCKTNMFSQWQSIVFVIVFFIQELNA